MSKSKRSRLSQGTVQNVTTAFEQFWLPKPLLLGSAQRLKRWGFCRNDPRNLASEVCRPSVSQRRPADVYSPNWGAYGPAAMDLAATGMRGSVLATSFRKSSTTMLPSCVLDKAYSSSRWWLKPAAVGGARPPLPPSENWALCTLLDLGCLRVMGPNNFSKLCLLPCNVRTCGPSSDGSPSPLTVCHPTARASPCVISKAVRDPVAQGAIAIRTCNRNTEPQTEQYPKKGRVQVKTKGRRWAG